MQRDNQESDYKSILEAIMNTLTLCADHKEHVKRRLGPSRPQHPSLASLDCPQLIFAAWFIRGLSVNAGELKEYYTQKRDMLLGTPEDGSALPV